MIMNYFRMAFLMFCISSPGAICFGAGSLFETISVGTATAAVGTTTIHNDEWATAAKDWVEGFYMFNAAASSTTLNFRFDGGTATANSGVTIVDKQSFKLKNIDDMKRVTFICVGGLGSVTATYSRSRRDNN